MDVIDRPGGLAIDNIAALTNHRIMKSDPVWAQLAPEIAAQQNIVVALNAKFNALLAKLDANHGAASDHVSTLGFTLPDPTL